MFTRSPMAKRKHNLQYLTKLRTDIVTTYGSQCVCCKETEPLFLTLDHINNDGPEHKKLLHCKGGSKLYADVRRRGYPNTYRLMCYNCNAGRWRNKGECPHGS